MALTQVDGGLLSPTNGQFYSMKNRIINGAMVIDQRNAGASVTPANGSYTYTLDRWSAFATQTAKFTVQQNAASVTPPSGFPYYLGMTVAASANVTVGASDVFVMRQAIEGLNMTDLGWGSAGAATVTMSFWVRSSLTGTFGGSLSSNTTSLSYPFTYTINSANTWEQKNITIAGPTTGGTSAFPTNNGIGVRVFFSIGVGSSGLGTAGAWASGDYFSATGATNLIATNSATFYITGVQLEKGSTATSFDYRPYGTELALCQRYYYRFKASDGGSMFGSGLTYSGTQAIGITKFPVTMRTNPTALEQSGTAGDYRIQVTGSVFNCTSVPAFDGSSVDTATSTFITSGMSGGQGIILRATNSNAYLGWSAEL